MKISNIIILACAAIVMSACGAKHFNEEYSKYDASKSKALNIALLAGLTTEEGPLKDSEPIQVSANSSDPSQAIAVGSSAALLAAQSTGSLLDVGMGQMGSMGMTGLSLLSAMGGQHKPQWTYNQIIAFMPKNLAKNKSDASMKLYEYINKSVLSSKDYEFKQTDSGGFYTINSVECEQGHICSISFSFPSPNSIANESWAFNNGDFLWGSKASISPLGIKTIIRNGNNIKHVQNNINSFRLYHSLSSTLPSWLYLYIAPNSDKKTPAYFLNQGKVLPFIKPVASTK